MVNPLKKKMKILFLALVLALFSSLFAKSQDLNFTFSFPLPNGYDGETPKPSLDGTITGEILGLENNDPSAIPTEVIVDSVPAAFGITTPFVFDQSDITYGSLSVEDGVLSLSTASSSFYLSNSAQTVGLLFNLSGANVFSTPSGDAGSAVSEITFAPISAPEPSAWMLALCAIGAFALSRAYTRKGILYP